MSKIADDFINQVNALSEGFEDIGYDSLPALIDEMDTFIRSLPIEEQIVSSKYLKSFIQFIIDVESDEDDSLLL